MRLFFRQPHSGRYGRQLHNGSRFQTQSGCRDFRTGRFIAVISIGNYLFMKVTDFLRSEKPGRDKAILNVAVEKKPPAAQTGLVVLT